MYQIILNAPAGSIAGGVGPVLWTCDRCGEQASTDKTTTLPEGWKAFHWTKGPTEHFCPKHQI
jgi:hypothetical protein